MGVPPTFEKFDKEGESNKWCGLMFLAAVTALVASFVKRFAFGIVGEAVTYQVRVDLFAKILSMRKSWFDSCEPSALISVLSLDTQTINGVATQSLSQ